MEVTTNYIGTTIIEVTVSTPESSITVDICDLNGLADVDFIESLKCVVEELEQHNKTIKDNTFPDEDIECDASEADIY